MILAATQRDRPYPQLVDTGQGKETRALSRERLLLGFDSFHMGFGQGFGHVSPIDGVHLRNFPML